MQIFLEKIFKKLVYSQLKAINKHVQLTNFMSSTRFITVILPLKLEWEPCYSLPGNMEVTIGTRVKVKFANKTYTAVVSATDIIPDINPSKIQQILSVEENLDNILPTEIELWKQVSEYYLCSVGEVYKAAYPMVKISLEEARAAAREKAVRRRTRVAESIKARIERLQTRLEKKNIRETKTKEGTKTKASLNNEIEKIKSEISFSLRALEKAEASVLAAEMGNISSDRYQPEDTVCLSNAQKEAYRNITDTFRSGKPALLHGITGSGKTEIYIRLAHEAISKGKNVLYLIPEIALSRQLEERLYEHFGERLLTYHSAETAASRINTAEIIRNSTGNIIIGTRSSLFLPLHDLGLIIVDEEHDSSYKQDSPAPRYNGRDTALMLHRIHKCNIILGSATPSFEEEYNCNTGRHTKTVLTERFHKAPEAETELIDTKDEKRKRGMVGNFSRKLIGHIQETLDKGEQILILRSRRSWAPVLQCSECGEIVRCPNCNVSMNLHKDGSPRMICHYCGHLSSYTGSCHKCSGQLIGLGAGTQKIEEEAAALFPKARIARLDSDTSSTDENKIIKEFAKGGIDILIGTQIIAKGFDFERLSLVAVIAADSLLGMTDFRSDEKALHLLEQFRGRCGRRNGKGLIVIQTAQPQHPIYQDLKNHSRDTFSIDMMQERKDFDYPPYTRIIELTIKDIYEERAEMMSRSLADELNRTFKTTGSYSPAVDKISGQYIRKIRITLKKDKILKTNKMLLVKTIRTFERERKYEGHIIIDVDPS